MAATSISASTFQTSTIPYTTSPPKFELRKRTAQECGDLGGAYPNAAAPTCAGSYSICTFSAGYQGCCDSSSDCHFFTSCQGGLASGAARCTASSCLQCSSAVPYCTQYAFGAYTGYACGSNDVGDLVIQGSVGSRLLDGSGTATTTGLTSSSTTSTSRTSNRSSTSASSSAGSTSQDNAQAKANSASGGGLSTGVIIGIAVAAALVIAFIIFIVWWKKRPGRHRIARPELEPMRGIEMQR